MLHKVSYVGVVIVLRMASHIFTIVVSKAGECLLLVQTMQLAKGKYFAGALVAAGVVADRPAAGAIVEAGWPVVVVFLNDTDDLGELQVFGVCVDYFDEFVDCHAGMPGLAGGVMCV